MINTKVISEQEAAERIGLSLRTLQRMRENGLGPAYVRMGEKRIGYMEQDLNEWLIARRCQPEREIEVQSPQ